MESLEKQQVQNSLLEDVKSNIVCKETDKNDTVAVKLDVCHKSNGVAEAGNDENVVQNSCKLNAVETDTIEKSPDEEKNLSEKNISDICAKEQILNSDTPVPEVEMTKLIVDATVTESEQESKNASGVVDSVSEVVTDDTVKPEDIQLPVAVTDETVKPDDEMVIESVVEVDFIEPLIDRVTFETEIVVENNDNDPNEKSSEIKLIEEHSNDLLNELGENIELSEALRASNTTDNMENNNCNIKQEMFNKEELLDILEGNDVEEHEPVTVVSKVGRAESQILETQLALQQLSRLKRTKKPKTVERQSKRRKSDKKVIITKKETELKEEESFVNSLVKDWDDEEPIEETEPGKILEDGKNLQKSSVDPSNVQEEVTKEDTNPVRTSIDSSVSDGQPTNLNKSGDETLPQRRLARIIKKKVIFDPDNPDTFTKGKTISKQKETQVEKDLSLYNKIKSDENFQRSKSKSPLSKLQWKKPPPKNSKQCRRLTEIDKLLMDEGAVNMIYQLTPEAPKGKKNMRTKAEFIKKIQSSTPDTKEMKFRERKKECKSEEGEAKRIAGGKQRPSLSSSVKSPSAYEDFEAHSADDSIIYRRHSSSSYSSSCMSPRRLSDVDVGVGNVVSRTLLQNLETQDKSTLDNNEIPPEVFMGDNITTSNEIINKNDCLSIKEKLNSKLSLALNKRKRDSHRVEKPFKQKKLVKTDDKEAVSSNNVVSFKYLSISIDKTLAEICIQKTGSIYNIEVIKELEKALLYIDSREDLSVTLLMSECGALCSGLDLKPLLVDNMETKTTYAIAIAESIRSLFCVLEQHSKMICTGVGARCSGVGLALFALSDVTLASEQASFILDSRVGANPLLPSIAALVHRRLPQPLLNDLVVFGSRLSASDALQSGLVNRTLWPDRYQEQLRAVSKDIAAQPKQNILLKKQLLNLHKGGTKDSFKSVLEKERNMLVEYWISDEGQKLIHDAYKDD